jgi:hypothetical protein
VADHKDFIKIFSSLKSHGCRLRGSRPSRVKLVPWTFYSSLMNRYLTHGSATINRGYEGVLFGFAAELLYENVSIWYRSIVVGLSHSSVLPSNRGARG